MEKCFDLDVSLIEIELGHYFHAKNARCFHVYYFGDIAIIFNRCASKAADRRYEFIEKRLFVCHGFTSPSSSLMTVSYRVSSPASNPTCVYLMTPPASVM